MDQENGGLFVMFISVFCVVVEVVVGGGGS